MLQLIAILRRDTCHCGHGREAHMHYRSGTDCSLCPPGECAKFRRKRRGDQR